jgi:four helix bundle protein
MATAKKFEELHVWQEARGLVSEIYKLAKRGGFARNLTLRNQIARAAISSMSNIAEGFERGSRNELIQFLNIAKGSVGEVRSQLYIGLDQGYIDSAAFKTIEESTLKLSRRLAAFVDYLKKCPNNSRSRLALPHSTS